MAYRANQTFNITNQPAKGNPFDELNGEWTVNLFSCCDNISQCKLII